MSGAVSRRMRFGPFEAHPAVGELRSNGRLISIQEQPFQVLLALLERAGEVISREELRERLWSAETFGDFDQGLNTAISKLREARSGTPPPARSSWKRYPSEATDLYTRWNSRPQPFSRLLLGQARAGWPAGLR